MSVDEEQHVRMSLDDADKAYYRPPDGWRETLDGSCPAYARAALDKVYESTPVKVVVLPGKGKALVAKEDIPAGTLLWVDHGFYFCPEIWYREWCCHKCMHYDEETVLPIACETCEEVYYCSEACQAADAQVHARMCSRLAGVKHFPIHEQQNWIRDLLVCVDVYLHSPEKRFMYDHQIPGPDFPLPKELDTYELMCRFAYGTLTEAERETMSFGHLVTTMFRTYFNEFRFPVHTSPGSPTFEYVAHCTYGITAPLNHSCAPNAAWSFHGLDQHIRTISDIAAGQEIELSYGCSESSYSSRQEHLLESYGFSCVCSRCQAEAKMAPEERLGSEDEDEDEDDEDDEDEEDEENESEAKMEDDLARLSVDEYTPSLAEVRLRKQRRMYKDAIALVERKGIPYNYDSGKQRSLANILFNLASHNPPDVLDVLRERLYYLGEARKIDAISAGPEYGSIPHLTRLMVRTQARIDALLKAQA